MVTRAHVPSLANRSPTRLIGEDSSGAGKAAEGVGRGRRGRNFRRVAGVRVGRAHSSASPQRQR
eukprot:4065173-Prymnesium_polylepis.3